MGKNLIKLIAIWCASIGSAYAVAGTGIYLPSGGAVQCNNWGWVDMYYYTIWRNDCTPLQARSSDQKVYTIATTENACGEDEIAIYEYTDGNNAINFLGCRGLSSAPSLQQNHH